MRRRRLQRTVLPRPVPRTAQADRPDDDVKRLGRHGLLHRLLSLARKGSSALALLGRCAGTSTRREEETKGSVPGTRQSAAWILLSRPRAVMTRVGAAWSSVACPAAHFHACNLSPRSYYVVTPQDDSCNRRGGEHMRKKGTGICEGHGLPLGAPRVTRGAAPGGATTRAVASLTASVFRCSRAVLARAIAQSTASQAPYARELLQSLQRILCRCRAGPIRCEKRAICCVDISSCLTAYAASVPCLHCCCHCRRLRPCAGRCCSCGTADRRGSGRPDGAPVPHRQHHSPRPVVGGDNASVPLVGRAL